jgi:cell division septal protein FtsQ
MTVTAPPRPPRPGDPVDRDELEAIVQALIEETRRRARRRRLVYAAAAASIALAGIVAFTVFAAAARPVRSAVAEGRAEATRGDTRERAGAAGGAFI